ncbi:MAG: hypothetical protein Q9219_000933 [cf. Caloplaca sp. 3 TL-2023]
MKLGESSSWKWSMKKSSALDGQSKIASAPQQTDAWTTVSNSKPRTIEKPSLRPANAYPNNPSSAAQSRRNVYDSRPQVLKPYYKHSALFVQDRNPDLTEIEDKKAEFKPGMLVHGLLYG